MKTKANNKNKSIIASLVFAVSIIASSAAHAGYVWYAIEIDTNKYLIEKIKTVSKIDKTNTYFVTTINGYKIKNTYSTLEKAQKGYNALIQGQSLDVLNCARPKYENELSFNGYYDYSVCAAGISTPTIDTADLLQKEHVVINIQKQPIKIRPLPDIKK